MKRYIILLITSFLVVGLVSCKKEKKVYNAGEPIEPEDIHWVIEYLVDSNDLKIYFPDRDVRSFLFDDLKRFYKQNEYQLAWNTHNESKKQAEELIEVLRNSWQEGLEPNNYRIQEIDSLEKAIFKKGVDSVDLHKLIHLDLVMTSSFLTYASHLVRGRVDPNKLNETWFTTTQKSNFVPLLKKAVGENKVKKVVGDIRPHYEQYEKLKEKLIQYYETDRNGGWPKIAEGPELKRGNRSPRVADLKKRLAVTGDLADYDPKADDLANFTAPVENAVKQFQDRHRLEPTGRVDQNTLQALNVPVSERIQQIKINMERMRWLPEDLGNHYVLVNVPEYYLRIIKNKEVEMHMKVIVGKEFNSTPIFSDTMQHIVFSPYWNVPNSIATEEMLPKIKGNPGFITSNNYEILSGWEQNPTVIDPYSVKWDTITAENFPYRIRQKPGGDNALGHVKFMFPNKMDIYLHDTPSDYLFKRDQRGFSHGCIRVEKPEDMAVYLLKDKPGYDRNKIQELMDSGTETYVNLENELPVHIIYWTTYVNEEGKLNFTNDIYSFDKVQINALEKKEKEM